MLLGDSVFDNKSYVELGDPDVVAQVEAALPPGSKATLLAVDGSVIESVSRSQIQNIPAGATHLVVSAGGNDLLGQMMLLGGRANSMADALNQLADIADQFTARYQAMLVNLLRPGLPLVLCTVYNPAEPDPQLRRLIETVLPLFDDIIIRQGVRNGLPVIDLRLVCTEPSDFANPIEPSAAGGYKIAKTIGRVLTTHDFAARHATVYRYE